VANVTDRRRGALGWLAPAVVATLVVVATACFPEAPAPTDPTTTTESTTTTTMPSTSVEVTTFADTDDGVCDETDCSLREAIAAADAAPELDTVVLPAGTFVIGGAPPAALRAASSDGLATVSDLAALSAGPNGEAFRTTSALTIQGAGSGETIIDFSGDDFNVAWLVEASLSLRDVTVRNLGTGTARAERAVVVGQMVDEGQQVTFDGTVVEDVQPDMVYDAGVAGGGLLVSSSLPGTVGLPPGPNVAFDVRVESSTVRRVANNWMLIQTWGGAVEIVDSTLEDTPPLSFGLSFGGVDYLPVSVSVTGSTLDRLAARGGPFPNCVSVAILDPGSTTSLGPAGGVVELIDSEITGAVAAATDAACGGQAASLFPPVYITGRATIDITRSLLVAPPGSANLLGAAFMSSTLDQNTGVCSAPDVTISDSTLWSVESFGLIFQGCNGQVSVEGAGVAIERSTIAGLATFAQPNPSGDPGVPAVTLESSAIVPGGTVNPCQPANSAGLSMVVSLGTNTSTGIQCGLDQTSDQLLDPVLGPLQDNGGPTRTAAPLTGSPVIDSAGACTGVDQRGVVRPQGVACDRGAVELEG
jgi:CSLREA domain-containing protein